MATRDDGHGLGDDPRYINKMIGWMEDPANNVAYESYFDYDGNAEEDAITDGDFPHSLFAFSSDFSGSASPSTVDTDDDNNDVATKHDDYDGPANDYHFHRAADDDNHVRRHRRIPLVSPTPRPVSAPPPIWSSTTSSTRAR